MTRILLALLVLSLSACGTEKREEKREERTDDRTTKTTTVVEKTIATPEGPKVVESVKTTTFTQEVANGETSTASVTETIITAPELKAVVDAVKPVIAGAANVVAPGFGSLISDLSNWFFRTPEGAATAIGVSAIVTAVTRRGVKGESDLRKKDRHLKAIVQGNSDFMQAHPDQADKLKEAQRSAQVDPELKAAVKKARLEKDLS